MRRTNAPALVFTLALTACSGPAAQNESGALVASDTVRAAGVDHYRRSTDGLLLESADGQLVATLQVSAPTADTRLVRIVRADGQSYEDEISRPVAGVFTAPLPAGAAAQLEGAVQLDPALASFFAGSSIRFVIPADEPAAATGLSPSAAAHCADITWAPGCYLCNGEDYPCTEYSDGSTTYADGYAVCPLVSCPSHGPPYYIGDLVRKIRTCISTGCSQQALGWVGCADINTKCG